MQSNRRLFESMADELAADIRRGQWKPGHRLPGIRDLEQTYPYSRVTIQKALALLKDQGYITISPRSGAFVRSAFVRDRIGILAGGLLPGGARAPLSMMATELACVYLHRCGYNTRVYADDPRSPIGIPEELDDDLQDSRLKALLTIQSSFGYRHLNTKRWNDHAVPHVDIGTLPARHRVYIDYLGFYRQAIERARDTNRSTIGLIDRGSGMTSNELQDAFTGKDLHVCTPPTDLSRNIGREAWGFRMGQHLLEQDELPHALIVPEASVAKGLIQAMIMQQVSFPEQLEITTLVNRGQESFFPEPIVRFEVDIETMTAFAGQMLIDLVNRPDLPEQARLLLPDPPAEAEASADLPTITTTR